MLVRVLFAAAMLLLVFGQRSAMAATTASDPRWGCWLNNTALSIVCVLLRSPGPVSTDRRAEILRNTDRRFPALVGAIWASPESIAHRRISIPLWNVPYEAAFTRQLAEAVMCGIRLDCDILFDHNADDLAPRRMAELITAEIDGDAELLAALAAETKAEPTRTTTRETRKRRAARH